MTFAVRAVSAALAVAASAASAAPVAAPGARRAAAQASGEAAVPAAPSRPLVARVELKLPPGEDPALYEPLLGVRAGEPLSPRALRRTVQLLYQAGRFANVLVRAVPLEPSPDGRDQVAVVVECLPRRVVDAVRVSVAPARPGVSVEDLRRAAGLEVGQEFQPGQIEEARRGVRRICERRGHRDARVRLGVSGEDRVAVEIEVDPGPATRVRSIDLGPRAGDASREALPALRTRAGAVLDLDVLDADVRALRVALRRAGHLRARVASPRLAVEGDRAAVEIPVEPGPRIEFRFAGNASVPSEVLRRDLGHDGEQPLDDAAIAAAAARLVSAYQARGHVEARVTSREARLPDGGLALVFDVEEGRRYRVGTVRFIGQTARDPRWLRRRLRELLEAMAREESSGRAELDRVALLSGMSQSVHAPARLAATEVYHEATWSEALLVLLDDYKIAGWLDAAHEGTRLDLDARRGVVDVEIRLREGVRTHVEAIEFEGNRALSLPDLRAQARLAPGDPLSFLAVEETRAALADLYAGKGFVYARVEAVEDLSKDRRTATLRFVVDEGPQVRIASVVVSGNARTREDVVRQALSVRAGEVYDPAEVARSQAALLRLGVFRSVALRLNDPDVPEAAKDLTVEVSERPWQVIASGLGFSIANGPRATLELSELNLLGRALDFTARAKVNYPLDTFGALRSDLRGKPPIDRIEGRADVGLHYPRVQALSFPVATRVDVIAERLHRRAYDLSRTSGVLGADLALTDRLTLSLQYELEVDRIQRSSAVQTVALTRADVERLRFPEGVTTLQSFRPVLALDHRDNSAHPRSGWFAAGVLDLVGSLGDTDNRFLRIFPGSDVYTRMLKASGTVSGYLPVGARSVLALSLRAGRVLPLDSDSVTIGPKRFFLGGAATMRGHAEDELIPEDRRDALAEEVRRCAGSITGVTCSDVARQLGSGDPFPSEGGESFLLLKSELRLPVRGGVEGGLFADLGNLWLDPRNQSFDRLRLDIGFGLRIATPVGPAVIDVGVNVDPDERVNERRFAPHFSIGLF